MYISIILFTYFLAVPITVFVAIDAYNRKNKWIFWSLGIIISWPVILPLYFSFRNLKENEKRRGGLIWNIIKNYILVYSTNIFVVIIVLLVLPQNLGYLSRKIFITEILGFNIELNFIYYVLFIIWFLPSALFYLIGTFFKDDYLKEEGPTGKLKEKIMKEKEEISKKLDDFYKEK
ncbi:MAG: hypothetical protein K9K32_03285 [Halanaerobiales bacterium]|nr:hypothetical protein [Halanaerobiales bacterium]